jgi:hypothetical protein
VTDLGFQTLEFLHVSEPGLPDFSRHKIPKREKIYQITTNRTNYP